MQEENFKGNDYDNDNNDNKYIDLAYLLYEEAKKTLLRCECEEILFNTLIDNDSYNKEEDKAKTL